jgi:hypothetical protein
MRRFVPAVLAPLLFCGLAAAQPARPGPRFVRCCVELEIPGVPAGPVCAQVRRRGGIGARRLCRLLGGRPVGRGDCSLALCAQEPA